MIVFNTNKFQWSRKYCPNSFLSERSLTVEQIRVVMADVENEDAVFSTHDELTIFNPSTGLLSRQNNLPEDHSPSIEPG